MPTAIATVVVCVSIAALLYYAGLELQDRHLAVAAAAAATLTYLGMAARRRDIRDNASATVVARTTAKAFGTVWLWGALAILLTYIAVAATPWPEWWHFALGFGVAAALAFGFSSMLARDAREGREDATMLGAGRVVAIVQLVGMIGGIISIFVDGKFPRAVTYADWAGIQITLCGALAIALLSAHALLVTPAPTAQPQAP